MDEQLDDVVLWKTSRRGLGVRHLRDGYPSEDFPGAPDNRPDGCAYFAKDRWIADAFADRQLQGYEDYVIEIRIPRDLYDALFRAFERPLILGWRQGVQLIIPAEKLHLLNESGRRKLANHVSPQSPD